MRDIERSVAFYVGKLGFEEMLRLDRDGRRWLIYLRITDEHYLKVFPDRAAGRRRWGTIPCVWRCRTSTGPCGNSRRWGCRTTGRRRGGAIGNWQAWIEDLDGHRIEPMQMMPHSLQVAAIARRVTA